MMTTFLPLTKTKTKRKNMKTKKVSLVFIATGVAQQKAIRQKGFSLFLEEDFRIFIQRTAINATIQELSNQCTNKCNVAVFSSLKGAVVCIALRCCLLRNGSQVVVGCCCHGGGVIYWAPCMTFTLQHPPPWYY